jgi:hypothetical protein
MLAEVLSEGRQAPTGAAGGSYHEDASSRAMDIEHEARNKQTRK